MDTKPLFSLGDDIAKHEDYVQPVIKTVTKNKVYHLGCNVRGKTTPTINHPSPI